MSRVLSKNKIGDEMEEAELLEIIISLDRFLLPAQTFSSMFFEHI